MYVCEGDCQYWNRRSSLAWCWFLLHKWSRSVDSQIASNPIQGLPAGCKVLDACIVRCVSVSVFKLESLRHSCNPNWRLCSGVTLPSCRTPGNSILQIADWHMQCPRQRNQVGIIDRWWWKLHSIQLPRMLPCSDCRGVNSHRAFITTIVTTRLARSSNHIPRQSSGGSTVARPRGFMYVPTSSNYQWSITDVSDGSEEPASSLGSECQHGWVQFQTWPKTQPAASWRAKCRPIPGHLRMSPGSARPVSSNLRFWFSCVSSYGCIQISYC